MRFAQRAACEVFLHHILIETRHHHHDEHAGEKLLPKILSRAPVVEDEDARARVVSYCRDSLGERHAECLRRAEDDQQQRGQNAKRLKRIGPHKCADAAPSGVEPDEKDERRHRHGKRHMIGVEDKTLKDHTDDIELHGRSRHLADEKKRRAGGVAPCAQPPLQIGVDTRQPEMVVNRQQHEGNSKVTEDITHAHLQVGHLHAEHHAGHRDKRHARYAGTNHAEGHHRPRRAMARNEEISVVGLAARQPRQSQQQQKIDEYGKDDDHGCKRRKKNRSSQK